MLLHHGGIARTKTVVQYQQLAAVLNVVVVSIYRYLSYITPTASYKWNCFSSGNSKNSATS